LKNRPRMWKMLGMPLLLLALALLWPGTAQASPVVLIDAGHGGFDHGIKHQGLREKDIVLQVAKALKRHLELLGVDAILSRRLDRQMSISERLAWLKAHEGAQVLLSLHLSSTQRARVYVAWLPRAQTPQELYLWQHRQRPYLPQSLELARAVLQSLRREAGLKVSLLQLPLPLLSQAASAAVLLELPHPRAAPYDNPMFRDSVVEAILKGLLRYVQ